MPTGSRPSRSRTSRVRRSSVSPPVSARTRSRGCCCGPKTSRPPFLRRTGSQARAFCSRRFRPHLPTHRRANRHRRRLRHHRLGTRPDTKPCGSRLRARRAVHRHRRDRRRAAASAACSSPSSSPAPCSAVPACEVFGDTHTTLFVVVGVAAFLGAGYRVPLAAVDVRRRDDRTAGLRRTRRDRRRRRRTRHGTAVGDALRTPGHARPPARTTTGSSRIRRRRRRATRTRLGTPTHTPGNGLSVLAGCGGSEVELSVGVAESVGVDRERHDDQCDVDAGELAAPSMEGTAHRCRHVPLG